MGQKYPWQDEQWCKERYVEKDMSISEMAEESGGAVSTIHQWLNRHGIDTSCTLDEDHPANDKERLRKMHHDNGLSVNKMALELDVSRSAIKNRLDKFGIERDYHKDPNSAGTLQHDGNGYELFNAGNNGRVRIHRLVACLENDPNEIFGSNKHVHHENGVKWDNRPENLSVETPGKHRQIHQEKKNKQKPYADEKTLDELFNGRGLSREEIAVKFGIASSTVSYWLNKNGIDT